MISTINYYFKYLCDCSTWKSAYDREAYLCPGNVRFNTWELVMFKKNPCVIHVCSQKKTATGTEAHLLLCSGAQTDFSLRVTNEDCGYVLSSELSWRCSFPPQNVQT